jgi:hypothetical protein
MKIVALAVALLAVGLLLLAACNSTPRKDQTLDSLPPAERAALDAICAAAGTEPQKLRDVGFAANFRDDRNRMAIAIRNGHVHTLALSKAVFAQPPDFSKLTALESLWLEDGLLQSWPDLSPLTRLKGLHLNGQPLGTPDANRLPKQIENLDLARTRVADLSFLAGFFSLRTLDVSGTRVQSIEPILGLELAEVNLANSPIDTLPPQLPARGYWELNLDGTPLTQIPNFWRKMPAYRFSSSTPTAGDSYTGTAQTGNVDVKGSIVKLIDARPVHLPGHELIGHELIEADSGPVTLTASIGGGKVRVWLRETSGLFAEPWFRAGKVKGWSSLRPMGSVSMDVEPGKPETLRGELWGVGTYRQDPYFFVVQPLNNGQASGFSFEVRTSK